MRFYPESTIAIAVDYQEKLVPIMSNKEEMIQKAILLAKGLNALSVPIWVTRQYPKGLGDTIEPIRDAIGEVPVYDKVSYSIYEIDALRAALREKNPKTILLFGMETHICVAQSAMDLKEAGYEVFVVLNACSSRFPIDKEIGIERLRYEQIGLTSVEATLFELCGTSKHPEFKQISNLVK